VKSLNERIKIEQAFLNEKMLEFTHVSQNKWTTVRLACSRSDYVFDWLSFDYRIAKSSRIFYVPEYDDGTFGELQEVSSVTGQLVRTKKVRAKIIKLLEV